MTPERNEDDSNGGPRGWWVLLSGGIGLALAYYAAFAASSMLTTLAGNQAQTFVFVVMISIFVWVFTTIFTALAERDRVKQFKALRVKNRELMTKIDSLLEDSRRWDIYNKEAVSQGETSETGTTQ